MSSSRPVGGSVLSRPAKPFLPARLVLVRATAPEVRMAMRMIIELISVNSRLDFAVR